MIELLLEYNPAPPFNVGSPERAGADLVEVVRRFGAELIKSFTATKQAAARLEIY